MNIFHLDKSPYLCAIYHCDKHVVKMILETAQMLCTAWRQEEKYPLSLYKQTHLNHPMSLWVRKTKTNYLWSYKLFIELQREYTYRYNKKHACGKFNSVLKTVPPSLEEQNIEEKEWTEPPQCMPDIYKKSNYVQGYRQYYAKDKFKIANWTIRNTPQWMLER